MFEVHFCGQRYSTFMNYLNQFNQKRQLIRNGYIQWFRSALFFVWKFHFISECVEHRMSFHMFIPIMHSCTYVMLHLKIL